MTRVEAIEWFKNSPFYHKEHEPFKMAIEALEQNEQAAEWYKIFVEKFDSCEDCISRQAVYDLMRSLTRWCVRSEDGKFNNVGLLYDDVMFGINRLPSVNPQTDVLDKIKAEIEPKCDRINSLASVLPYTSHREIQELLCDIMDLLEQQESEET